MIRDRVFYKSFFAMWIVLVLQNVVTLSVNLADNIMLGGYAEAALSGVSAVNQIQFVYQQILLAFGDTIVIIGSQYYGRGRTKEIHDLTSLAMRFGIAASVILFVLMSIIPDRVLMIFTNDEAIIQQGVAYVGVIRFTYLLFAITQILVASLRSVGTVNIALILSLVSLGINCFMNYTLIYGHFGAPEMGAVGAAIATLMARAAELLILLFYIIFHEKKLNLRFRDFLHTDRELNGNYVRVMLPMLIVNSMWGLNNAAQNAILGHMTSRAIAANSVASNLFLIVKSTAQGSCGTASFFIGRAIGEGDKKKVRSYATTMQVLFVLIGICSGILLYFVRIPVLSLYNLEPETMAMANQFLIVLAIIEVFMSYQMPTNAGIIKGGGDTKYAMLIDLISIWCIVLPLSAVMAFVFNASPLTVLWCLNADQIFKGVPAFIKCNFGHWARKLTKEDGQETAAGLRPFNSKPCSKERLEH